MIVKTLKDHNGPNFFKAPAPGLLSDGAVFALCEGTDVYIEKSNGHRIFHKWVGWKRETEGARRGQLGFIAYVGDDKCHCGIDPKTYKFVRIAVLPTTPKTAPSLPKWVYKNLLRELTSR
jgi:hypothetical protein